MDTAVLKLETPIDFLVETDEHLVACGYVFEQNTRHGGIYFLDKRTLVLLSSRETTGTLQACYSRGILYTANASDITAFVGFDKVASYPTAVLNTCIATDGCDVYVGNINGDIRIFDAELRLKAEVHISRNPIWTMKIADERLYLGDEGGCMSIYRLADGAIDRIEDGREGIIDILIDQETLRVSSYDEDLVIYDKKSLVEIKRHKRVGALWKMIQIGDYIVSSCIYQGVRIFDLDFKLLRSIETESICYGVCCLGSRLVWAPYYNGCIRWMNIELMGLDCHNGEVRA